MDAAYLLARLWRAQQKGLNSRTSTFGNAASPRNIAPDAAARLAAPLRGTATKIVAVMVDPDDEALIAFRGACWYSWSEQIKSMARLLDYRFEWVLPGHGRPIQLPAAKMHAELERCVSWMKTR